MQNPDNRKVQDEKGEAIVRAYMQIMDIPLVKGWECKTEKEAEENGCDIGYKSFHGNLDGIVKATTVNSHTLQDTFGREYFAYMGDYDNIIQSIYRDAKAKAESMTLEFSRTRGK